MFGEPSTLITSLRSEPRIKQIKAFVSVAELGAISLLQRTSPATPPLPTPGPTYRHMSSTTKVYPITGAPGPASGAQKPNLFTPEGDYRPGERGGWVGERFEMHLTEMRGLFAFEKSFNYCYSSRKTPSRTEGTMEPEFTDGQ